MTDPTLVPVAVACPCPGAPHDGDTVYLRGKLGLHGGMVAQRKIIEMVGGDSDSDEVVAQLAEVFCRYGVDSATFVGEDGELLSPAATIDLLLSDFGLGYEVGNAAAELYQGPLTDPLVERASKSSRRSRTRGSTSARTTSSAKRRKPSKPSSITTIPTVDTATT